MFAIALLAGCSLTTGGNLPPSFTQDAGQETSDARPEQDADPATLDARSDVSTVSGDAGVDAYVATVDGGPGCTSRTFELGDLAAGEAVVREVDGDYAQICISWDEVSISSRTVTIGGVSRCLPCVFPPVTSYCFPYAPGEIVIDNTHCAEGSCGAQTAMEDVVVEVLCE